MVSLASESASSPSDFKIGEWWIRPQRHVVERLDESHPIELRSMDVLVCLAGHAPDVVSKQRLLDEVWHDSPYVGDDVISHAIWELRKVLGDSARQPTYIRTVPRRGYQLLAEVLRPQGSPLPLEGVRIDHYDIGGEIGRGAMGVVFEATDRRLDRRVAIKFLAEDLTRDPKACRRFEREARLAASLEHPNLATVHEVGETSRGHRYLVTSLYGGGSLKDRLADGPLDPKEAIDLVRQLLAGLGAAHARGVVHRDIKPANLLLDGHGTLKICDFGIAKLLGATDLTRTGASVGTPAYKSPEQSRGLAVDHRTDLWSAGVVLFELLIGRRPFGGGDFEEGLVEHIGSGALDADVAALPQPLRLFLMRALAKDPADRFPSAEAMSMALGDVQESGGRPGVPGGRSRLRTPVNVGFAVVLAIAALWWMLERRPAPAPALSHGVDFLVEQAQDHWLRGNDRWNLATVQKTLEKAEALAPDSTKIKGLLAALHVEQFLKDDQAEYREKALEKCREARDLGSVADLARAACARLLIFESAPTPEAKALLLKGAEDQLRAAIAAEPSCGPKESCDLPRVWLAEVLWEQEEKREAALEELDRCLEVGAGNIRCRLKQAQLWELGGNLHGAEGAYLRVLVDEPKHSTALNDLGLFYVGQGRYDEALPQFQRLYSATLDPGAKMNSGYVFYKRKLWKQSRDDYLSADRRYLELGLSKAGPLTSVGDSYLEEGNTDQAEYFYKQALVRHGAIENPTHREAALHAVTLAKLGRFELADEILRELFAQKVEVSYPGLYKYAARVAALQLDRAKLMGLAQRGIAAKLNPESFRDDPAFIPFRQDHEYQGVLIPDAYIPD